MQHLGHHKGESVIFFTTPILLHKRNLVIAIANSKKPLLIVPVLEPLNIVVFRFRFRF